MPRLSRHSTFRDLVVVVAEYRGTAYSSTDGTEMVVPQDEFELHRCMELVQRGWQRVVQSWSHWEWKKRTINVVLKKGDNLIRMPWFFNGRAHGDAYFEPPGPNDRIVLVSRQLFHGSQNQHIGNNGRPRYGTFERNMDNTTPGVATEAYWNMRIWPESDSDYTLRMLVEAEPRALWDLDDAHYAGPDYDRLVRLAALAEAELDVNKAPANYDGLFREELGNAVKRSGEINREVLGTLQPTDGLDEWYIRGDPPITLNGVRIL
jgi:hypothetical protein